MAAGGFNITAQIILRAPTNVRPIAASIQKQLQGVNATVNIQLPRGTASQISSLNAQLQGLQANLNSVNKVSAGGGLGSASRSFATVAKQAQQAKSATYEFGEAIGQAARKFGAFSIAAGALVSLISSIKEGVGAAINFQHEMIRLQQVANGSKAGIAGIAEEITRLSTTLGSSSADLSKVAVTLRQAGLSADETRVALSALAEASLAPTFDDIGNSVEGAIAVMQQFNVQASELKNVFGSINRVSADFAVEADDIVHAIRRTGGAFKAAGGDLNELMALFTSVRQTTRESAETIASGFNTIFARVQRPEAVEQLRLMGIQLRYTANEAKAFGKTEGEFVGPYEAVRRLNQALSSVPTGSAEYAAIVEQIGGFRQVSKVIPLIQQFGVAEKALGSAMYGQTSLARSNVTAQQSLTVQISQLKEEFLSLFRVIGANRTLQQFAGAFLSIAKSVVSVTKALTPLIPLIATLATAKLATTLGQIGTSGFASGLKSGIGKNRPFATGGVVPGTGNGDTVPANLTPGEFVIRKSAAKSIGYDNLHAMNRGADHYAIGGAVRKRRRNNKFKPTMFGNELEPRILRSDMMQGKDGFDDILQNGVQDMMLSEDDQDNLHKKRTNVQYYADGGAVKIRNPNFNRLVIKPPQGKVGMFVTGTRVGSGTQTPILPVSNLKGDAKQVFDRDKAQLVASGALTEDQAKQITNVTVPIAIRSPNEQKGSEVKSIIRSNITSALEGLASKFSEDTAGIQITKTDANRVLNETINENGVGRIFEGFLKVVGAKTGSKTGDTGSGATFDFDPVDSKGLSNLFGNDLFGLQADAKLNDNANSRASVVSKALRRYGVDKNISLDKLAKTYKVKNKTTTVDKTTGQKVSGFKEVELDPISYAKRQLKSKKFALGGVVRLASGGEPFSERRKQKFLLHEERNEYLPAYAAEEVQSKGQGFQLADEDLTKLVKKAQAQRNVTSNQKRVEAFKNSASLSGVLKIPFPGDLGIGVIGRGTVGMAGETTAERGIGGTLSKGDNQGIAENLKKLGVKKINMAYTRHVISQQATQDFQNSLHGPVVSAINSAFTSRFGDVVKSLDLKPSETKSLEGTLFEKYIAGVSKTVLGGTDNGKESAFDFPNGISPKSSLNTVVLPKLARNKRIDAKISIDNPNVEASLAGKYLAFNSGRLAELANAATTGKPPKAVEVAPDFERVLKISASLQRKQEALKANSSSSPEAKKEYEAALDQSIAVKRLLTKLQEQHRYDLTDTNVKPYATGGSVKASPRHFNTGGSPTGTDTVPALLTPGEFVFSRESAQKIGYNNLHNLNRYADGGVVQKFADGGVPKRRRRYEDDFHNAFPKKGSTFYRSFKEFSPEYVADFLGQDSQGPSTPLPTRPVQTVSNFHAPTGRFNFPGIPSLSDKSHGFDDVVGRRDDGSPVTAAQLHKEIGNNRPQSQAASARNIKNGSPLGDNISPRSPENQQLDVLKQILRAIQRNGGSGGSSGRTKPESITDISSDTSEKPGFKGRLAKFGGPAAILAAQFAPQAIEHVFGTVEKPTGSQTRAKYAGAAGSAISLAATGAATGALLGPQGAIIGGIAGAAYGFVSSLKEASAKIREIQFDKDFKSFSSAIQRATGDMENIAGADLGQIRVGLDKIKQEANLSSNKEQFFAEKVPANELQALLTKIAGTADLKVSDTDLQQRDKILSAQGGAGSEIVEFLKNLPEFKNQKTSDVLGPIQKIALKQSVEKSNQAQLVALEGAMNTQIKSFGLLANVVDRAASRLESLNSSLETTASLAEGSFKASPVTRFTNATANFGTGGSRPEELNAAIDFITAPAKEFGGDLIKDFAQSSKDINLVLSNFPKILGDVTRRGLDDTNIASHFRDAVRSAAPGVSESVVNRVGDAASTMKTPDLLKRVTTDLPGLIEDFKKIAFASPEQVIVESTKKLQDIFNGYAANINKFQELQSRLGDAQDKYVDLQLEAVETERKIIARRAGISGGNLTPQERSLPFQARQERLTGFTGGSAVDPNTIANRLNSVVGQIKETTEQRDKLLTSDPEGAQTAQKKLADLGSTANDLQASLKNLADASQRNAALQERLNQLNEEAAQRMNIAERYAVASPQDRFKMDQVANVSNAVATGQANFEGLPPEMKQAIISLSHDLEEIPTRIFGGVKGKEFRGALLSNNVNPNVRAIANLPVNRERERQGLENQSAANVRTAIEAQGQLMTFLKGQNETFFTKLEDNQAKFLSDFQKGLVESNKAVVEAKAVDASKNLGDQNNKVKAASDIAGFGITTGFANVRTIANDKSVSAKDTGIAAKISQRDELKNYINNADKLTSKITDRDVEVNRRQFGPRIDYQLGAVALKGSFKKFNFDNTEQENIKSRVDNGVYRNLGKNSASDINEIVVEAIRDQLRDKLNTSNADINTTASNIAGNLPRENGKQVDPSQVIAVAANLEKVNEKLTIIGNAENVGKLEESAQAASDALESLNEKIRSFDQQLDGFNPPKVQSPQLNQDFGSFVDKMLFGQVQNKATGGPVFQARGTDTVPAMLSPGEFIVNSRSARANASLLQQINSKQGTVYRAGGGFIPRKRELFYSDDEINEIIEGGNSDNSMESLRQRIDTVRFAQSQNSDPNTSGDINASLDNLSAKAKLIGPSLTNLNAKQEDYDAAFNLGKDASEGFDTNNENYKSSPAYEEVLKGKRAVDYGKLLESKKLEDKQEFAKNYKAKDKGNIDSFVARGAAERADTDRILANFAPPKVSDREKNLASLVQDIHERTGQDKKDSFAQSMGNFFDSLRDKPTNVSAPGRISRKNKRYLNNLDGLTKTYGQKDPNSYSTADLQQGADIQRYIQKQTELRNPEIAARAEAFKATPLAGALSKEQKLRAQKGVPQIAPQGYYVDDNGAYSPIRKSKGRRSTARRAAEQVRYQQSQAALAAPILSQKSDEDFDKFSFKDESQSVDDRTVALRQRNKNRGRRQRVAAPAYAGPIGAAQQLVAQTGQTMPQQGVNPLANAAPIIRQQEVQIKQLQGQVNQLINRLKSAKVKGFAEGGLAQASGSDVVPAMLSPGEFIVSAGAAKANASLLNTINKSRGPIYRASGGSVGTNNLSANSVGSGASLNLSADSMRSMTEFARTFSDSVNRMGEPFRAFGESVASLTGAVSGIRELIGPMNLFSQNIQLLRNPFDGFNTAATNLGAGMALFNRNAEALASAINGLSNLPSTITVQGTTQVNVAITGGEAFNALREQMQDDIIKAVSAKLKPEIVSDLKNGSLI